MPILSLQNNARFFMPVTKKSNGVERKTKAAASAPNPPPKRSGDQPKPSDDVQQHFGEKADDALEKLKNAFANLDEKKMGRSAKIVSGVIPISKNGKVTGKVLSANSLNNSTVRSMPSSPALGAMVGSPSLDPLNNMSDKAKKQRAPIIHELAVEPRPFDYLLEVYKLGTRHELQIFLQKVATFNDDLQAWELKKMSWKELDVYNYPYKSEEERQAAIDNAIKQYDRQRLGTAEPEWDRLLPKEERGTGKCLSRLQATLAKNAAGGSAYGKSSKAEPSSGSSESGSTQEDGRPSKKLGGESMARSSSQPITVKAKKVSEREVQAKRLLSNSKKPAPAKSTTPKVSPVKGAQKGGAKDKGQRILSKEFISDSDESDDDDVPLSAKNSSRDKVPEKPKAPPPHAAPASRPKPAARPAPAPAKAEVAAKPTKRPREEPDDSSSSGSPLSKRLKPKEQQRPKEQRPREQQRPKEQQRLKDREQKPAEPTIRAAPPTSAANHRSSETSQNSRTTTTTGNSGATSFPAKSKNTSPVKSSPLASSPPTNASDLEQPPPQDSIVASTATKRKAADMMESAASTAAAKRQRLSMQTLSKAKKYRVFYSKYEEMHWKLVGQPDPPADKVQDLLEMRERLVEMKAEIYKEVCPPPSMHGGMESGLVV